MKRGGIWAKRAGLLGLAGLLLLGNLAFFLWYRATAGGRAEALVARRTALERDLEGREKELSRLAGERDHLTQVSTTIREFYERRVGGQHKMLAAVVDEIHSVLKTAGVSPAEISYQTSSIPNPPLTEMRATFAYKGEYGSFKKLLAAFESNRRWIVVREIGLTRIPESPGSVQVRVVLATYFAREEEPAARTVSLRGSVPR